MRLTERQTLTDAEAIAEILALLNRRTGYDFSCYRPQTVLRRIRNRMISKGVPNVQGYLGQLIQDPAESAALLERLTIKVSRFYRNALSFDPLRGEVLPRLAERFGQPLRLWSAGCAHGEEPYTLAILLEEAGITGEILATDIDAVALAHARRAEYPGESIAELPTSLAAIGVEPVPGRADRVRVKPSIRERVHFCVHDLTRPVPPTGSAPFHLISCRNVLIYLRREAQERSLSMLRRALLDGGTLCLGEAEWPSATLAAGLMPLQPRSRLFEARST